MSILQNIDKQHVGTSLFIPTPLGYVRSSALHRRIKISMRGGRLSEHILSYRFDNLQRHFCHIAFAF